MDTKTKTDPKTRERRPQNTKTKSPDQENEDPWNHMPRM